MWPNNARLAVSMVVNFEEGSEYNVARGDSHPEFLDEVGYPLREPIRNIAVETQYEYGTRAGFRRMMNLFDKHKIPVTFFACGMALEQNPQFAREIVEKGHEVCSHGYRWIEHFRMSRDEERENIRKAVESIERTTGQRPLGWYCRFGPSENTRELLVEEGGFVYDSDSYADDVPYYVRANGKKWLVIPYALDTNDSRYWTFPALLGPSALFEYLKEAFDYLYLEGESDPKMMSVGLHLRIVGRPGRAAAVAKFLEYATRFRDVWFARRIDIARWWLEHHPE